MIQARHINQSFKHGDSDLFSMKQANFKPLGQNQNGIIRTQVIQQ